MISCFYIENKGLRVHLLSWYDNCLEQLSTTLKNLDRLLWVTFIELSLETEDFFAVRCNVFNLPLCGGFWTGADTFVLLDCWKTFGCNTLVYVRFAQDTLTVVHVTGWQMVSTVSGIILGWKPCLEWDLCWWCNGGMMQWHLMLLQPELWQQRWKNSISGLS